MLHKLIDFSIRNKLIIGLLVLVLSLYGLYQATQLPIDAVPDITNNQVQIIAVAPSYGATDIERMVTFPVEMANRNIPGITEVRSFSRFGLSLVTIVFEDDVDIYWARQQVNERLLLVRPDLPAEVTSLTLGPVTTGLGEIYQYTLRAEKGFEKQYDLTSLRTLQDWTVRRQLLGVEGVADVSSFGGKLKQLEVKIKPGVLNTYHIGISDVFKAIEANNQNTGGSYIEKGPSVVFIRSEGLFRSTEDIGNIFISRLENGSNLLLRDVAEIQIGYATRYGALCYNDEGEVAGGIVMMLKGGNSSKVIKSVKERVKQIQRTLPKGVIMEPFLDRTKMVNNAMNTVLINLSEGALIVLFVLVFFLGSMRAGLIVASVIPLSMLFAVIAMNQFGVIGNLMSLGALDFGLIVDGSVIIVEAVMHRLSSYNNDFKLQSDKDLMVSNTSKRIGKSVIFGQVIILIVYLPTFTLRGIEGKMFIPMAQTVSFALCGAFILSFTYVPMMSALLLKRSYGSFGKMCESVFLKVESAYLWSLNNALKHTRLVLTSTVIIFILAIFLLTRMGGEFIPTLEEGDFAVETRVLSGSNLLTSVESTQKVVKILKQRFPEIEQIVTKTGSGEIPTDPMPLEASDMMIILKSKKDWVSAGTFDELASRMKEAASEVPGVTLGFQFPVQMRFNELMTGAKQDVVCKIFGENLDTLARYGQLLGKIAESIEGTDAVFVEPVSGMSEIVINYHREALARNGVSIEELNRIVNISMAGQSAGRYFEDEKSFDVVVKMDKLFLNNIEDIRNIPVKIAEGRQIPLRMLAEVYERKGANQIQREDAKRRIIVGFNMKERDIQSTVEELRNKVQSKLKFPPGYYVTYGGSFENLEAARHRLSVAVPLALVLILVLLYFTFRSLRYGLLIYTAIPLSAIGGILALYLRDMPFSISAGVGFIALFGVAVLDGIVLITEFLHLKTDTEMSLHELVKEGSRTRLRPVLITASVASLGFLPMALSSGSGAEVQRPLATVVIGGLIVATFLTLYVLPILFVMFDKPHQLKTNKKMLIIFFMITLFVVPGFQDIKAQNIISLQAAIDTAVKQNFRTQNAVLNTQSKEANLRSAWAIDRLNATFEYGSFNSRYSDNKLSLSQNFKLPFVYHQQYKLNKQELNGARILEVYETNQIKLEVEKLYLEIAVKTNLLNWYKKSDSLFTKGALLGEMKIKAGESGIAEIQTARLQMYEIRILKINLETDLKKLIILFNQTLNSKQSYYPDVSIYRSDLGSLSPSSKSMSSIVKWYENEFALKKLDYALKKKEFWPLLTLGYSNTTIKGTGADNVFYTGSNRFQSVQAGLHVPLFFSEIRSKAKVASIHQKIAENKQQYYSLYQEGVYKSLTDQISASMELLKYFDSEVIPESVKLEEALRMLLESGEVNFSDWTMAFRQLLQINENYYQTLQQLNNAVCELKYIR